MAETASGVSPGHVRYTMKITPNLDPSRLPYMLSTKQAAAWLNISEDTLRYQMRIVRNDLCGKMEETQ